MRSKTSNLPKYVYRQTVKGRTYYRFRRGKITLRLPGEPGTPQFMRAYADMMEGHIDNGRYAPDSVAHTIDLYTKSADYAQLKPSTQRDYGRYLKRLDRSVGELPMGGLDRAFLHGIRDKLKDTPGAANHAMAVYRQLFAFAKSRGIVGENIAVGFKRLKGGEAHKRWPESQIEIFRARADPMMVLALDLGLYTGQRLSDVIRMTWTNYDGHKIRLKQQKTGAKMVIPAHPKLIAQLDAAPRTGVMILTTKTGRAYHERVFSRDFLRARQAAGIAAALTYHGLRHTAASKLAEMGCSTAEIQAITGHKSLKLTEHYTRQVDQERQAENAIARLFKNEK